jgi:hypothetical protein
MRTRRAITINNSLVHGICNCSCVTCNVNKPTYQGPRAYQTREIVTAIKDRVLEAAREGLFVRAIGNSGAGEPTLHPEFAEMMEILGGIRRSWSIKRHPAPDVCIVTNGHRLVERGIIEALSRNQISVKLSFPTCDPQHYSAILQPANGETGERIFERLIPSIAEVMRLRARGDIPRLEFHISPPTFEYLRPDFPRTLEFLAKLAAESGLTDINIKMFPILSNRSGKVKLRRTSKKVDLYPDYFERYNKTLVHGIYINMFYSYDFFYPSFRHFFDLWRAFKFPCVWVGNIFLSPFGGSDCPNDQGLREQNGNILTHSLRQIMEIKEDRMPGDICKPCNQKPLELYKVGFLPVFHLAAHLKMKWSQLGNSGKPALPAA